MKECRFLFPSGPTNHRRRHVCRTWAALLWVGKVAGSIGHAWRKFLGLQDGADPMEMALLDDIFGGETQVWWCHKSFSKKQLGPMNMLLHQVTLCSGAYARDMGVWSLGKQLLTWGFNKGFCRKKNLRRHEVEMDGNTSATKRKASEEASSLDIYHQPNSSNLDLHSMKLTHGGIWKQIQVKEKKKNQSSKAQWAGEIQTSMDSFQKGTSCTFQKIVARQRRKSFDLAVRSKSWLQWVSKAETPEVRLVENAA